jgi:division protein CdvB (Snf7/Vps24/ESCRT-III family)
MAKIYMAMHVSMVSLNDIEPIDRIRERLEEARSAVEVLSLPLHHI